MRYLFNISYDGTDYSGWQRQPNAQSVQQVIEEKISLFTGMDISILGCGRTDAGVHASDFYFHVDLPDDLMSSLDYRYKLNNMLPSSIAVKDVQLVNADFHARFDATARTYSYFIHFKKDPFLNSISYYCSYRDRLDLAQFDAVIELIKRYEDFASFCKAHSDNKTTICRIYDASWEYLLDKDQMIFKIRADRYLRGMIRLIVGACINVARGKMTLKEVESCLEAKKPLKVIWSAPPQGLFLSKVEY